MGNRKITKVTPAMEWSRKRWTTKGRLRACGSQLHSIIDTNILTNQEQRSAMAIIKRLETLDRLFSERGPESKENWLRSYRVAAWNRRKNAKNA